MLLHFFPSDGRIASLSIMFIITGVSVSTICAMDSVADIKVEIANYRWFRIRCPRELGRNCQYSVAPLKLRSCSQEKHSELRDRLRDYGPSEQMPGTFLLLHI